MRIVVHRIDAPFVTRAVMLGVQDAVHDRVAEQHVRVRHVDFGSQHLLAVGELALFHPLEQVEVFLDRAVAPGRLLAGLGYRAAREADLFLRLVIDIGQAFLDQDDGPVVELVEIVRRIAFQRPVETQPPDVALDRIHVLHVLLHRVGVVETQVALAAVFLGQAEVDADALGVADMQVAVGFGRETCLYARVALGDRLLNDLFEKVRGFLLGIGVVGCDCHSRYIFHKITTFFRLCVYFLGR